MNLFCFHLDIFRFKGHWSSNIKRRYFAELRTSRAQLLWVLSRYKQLSVFCVLHHTLGEGRAGNHFDCIPFLLWLSLLPRPSKFWSTSPSWWAFWNGIGLFYSGDSSSSSSEVRQVSFEKSTKRGPGCPLRFWNFVGRFIWQLDPP